MRFRMAGEGENFQPPFFALISRQKNEVWKGFASYRIRDASCADGHAS